MSELVCPGRVDWTGDNPFIYLKREGEDTWSSLSLFFRVSACRLGTGHVMLVIEDPAAGREAQGPVRLCLTDNPQLTRYLMGQFVRMFGLFRPLAFLSEIPVHAGAQFTTAGGSRSWTEIARLPGQNLEVSLTWAELEEPFAAIVPAVESATRRHEMMSVFCPAPRATVTVNGRTLPGAPVVREFLRRHCWSAALALSETWLRP
jgi:hypothetical protein